MPADRKRPPTAGTRRGNGSMGPGYGGPAKGAGNGSSKTDFGPDTNAQGHNGATPETRNALRREQAEQLKDMLHQLALSGESKSARVQAASAFLNRVEGMPKVTVENVTKPVEAMSRAEIDAEIAAERARVAGEASVPTAGTA